MIVLLALLSKQSISLPCNLLQIKPNYRVSSWKPAENDEISILTGIILQNMCPKLEIKMYFSRWKTIEMPFYRLLKFLDFVENSTLKENTIQRKLEKFFPILNHLQQKFMSAYISNRNIAIYESLIGWKDRLGLKLYILSKRKRLGIKLYALCEIILLYILEPVQNI